MVLLGFVVSLRFIESYKDTLLPSLYLVFTGFYWKSLGFTSYYWVKLGFYWVLPSFYRVFIEFYWV